MNIISTITKVVSLVSLFIPSYTRIGSGVGNHINHNHNNIQEVSTISQQQCNILSLSGGGSFGMVEVGILQGLYDKGTIPEHYDVITGISAGGLNTGFLSYYNNTKNAIQSMYEIYSSITNDDIYNRDLLKILSEWSIYSTQPLHNTLTKIIQSKSLEPKQENTPICIIGATNVINEVIDIYRFDTLNNTQKVDLLMSTSAIPIIFPPHRLNNNLYVDGGVITNELIYQSIGYKKCLNYNIDFISASQKNAKNPQPTGLISYIGSILHILYNTFDYQISQFAKNKCSKPIATINACYPNSELLNKYSILDFNHGAEIYNISKNNFKCEPYYIC